MSSERQTADRPQKESSGFNAVWEASKSASKYLGYSIYASLGLMFVVLIVGFIQIFAELIRSFDHLAIQPLRGLVDSASAPGMPDYHVSVPAIMSGVECLLLAPLPFIILCAVFRYTSSVYRSSKGASEGEGATQHSFLNVKGFAVGILFTVVATHLVGNLVEQHSHSSGLSSSAGARSKQLHQSNDALQSSKASVVADNDLNRRENNEMDDASMKSESAVIETNRNYLNRGHEIGNEPPRNTSVHYINDLVLLVILGAFYLTFELFSFKIERGIKHQS